MNLIQVAEENEKLREEGIALSREIDGVVNTFNKALHFKEKKRAALRKLLESAKGQCHETLDKIHVLDKNLAIYEQNLRKISIGLDDLKKKETRIRENYEVLLSGAQLPKHMETGETADLSVSRRVVMDVEEKLTRKYDITQSGRNLLIKRRREFLEKLDGVFKKYDEDLFYIDALRGNLFSARAEIERKKTHAQALRASLDEALNRYLAGREHLEKELEEALEEETAILGEYHKLLLQVRRNMEIGERTDELLFTQLSLAEREEEDAAFAQSCMQDSKARLKILKMTPKSAAS